MSSYAADPRRMRAIWGRLDATCNLDPSPAQPRLDLPDSSHATDKRKGINECCLRLLGFGVVFYAASF